MGIFLSSFLFATMHIPKIILASEYLEGPSRIPVLDSFFIFGAKNVGLLIGLRLFVWFLVIGLLFGAIRHKSNSVYYAIGSHSFANFLLYLIVLST